MFLLDRSLPLIKSYFGHCFATVLVGYHCWNVGDSPYIVSENQWRSKHKVKCSLHLNLKGAVKNILSSCCEKKMVVACHRSSEEEVKRGVS